MRPNSSPLSRSPYSGKSYRSRRSSALIIVLACLVFISVLIIAFFASVTTERQSAQFYANSSSVKLLSDSTLSIVMGQIVNATRGSDASGSTLSWASQPGMIRNYNLQGTAAGYFKLYSSTNMVGTGSFNPYSSTEQIPAGWAASTALYTDLNDPIVVGSGASATTNYPVVDPLATNMVAGFSITGAPTSTTDTAPMPVQWLYVLQQGQVIGPDPGGNGTTATFTKASVQPSAANQIVGRIAFWTDDDTCKVNINTAAGDAWVNTSSASSGPAWGSVGNPGSFWDTPRIWDNFETNLAGFQPANGEYQRYPGHPATVYLSSVFTNILTTPAQVYALTPRISLGGSKSGTTYPPASMLTAGQVASSRLYASVDELLTSTNVTAGSPPTRNLNSPLTKTYVEQGKFFLTAVSRAPEVNLFNQPRVIVWPVSSNSSSPTGTYRTSYDNLIAYCGTLNGNLYYFQRGPSTPSTGAYSATSDLPPSASTTTPATDLTRNRQLITYLRNLTSLAVPGFSTATTETFVNKYPQDRDQILTEIFDYVRALNTQDISVTNPYTPSTWLTKGEGQIFPITDTTHADSNTTALRGFGHLPIITEATLLFAGIGQTSSVTGSTTMYSPPAPASSGPITPGFTRIQAAFFLKFFDPSQGYATYSPNFKVNVTNLSNMNWTASDGTTAPVGFKSPATITVTSYVGCPSGGTGGESGIAQCVFGSGYTSATSGFIGVNTLDTATGTLTAPGTFSISKTDFIVTITDTAGATLQTYNLEFPAGSFPVPMLAPYVTDTSVSSPTIGTADFRNLTSRFNSSNSQMLQTFICGADVIRSIAATTDPRTIAALATVPLQYSSGSNSGKNIFAKVTGYDSMSIMQAHGITDFVNGNHRSFVGTVAGTLVSGTTYSFANTAPEPDFNYSPTSLATAYGTGVQPQATMMPSGTTTKASGIPSAAAVSNVSAFTLDSSGYAVGVTGVFQPGSTTIPGDWDTGNGNDKDGAYINKADEGAIPYNITGLQIPYYGAGYKTSTSGTINIAPGANFSPNRQMPSAGMFGSLPTGVFANNPWQTLLFRPSPDGKVLPSQNPGHLGAKSPQDHLLMDLFNMPVVEPYAISDPFSTAGKVNMNYQIVPFTYLTRSTAVQAAMRSEQILAVPGNKGTAYKASGAFNYRYFLDLDQTLTGFTNMFTTGTPDGTGSTPDIFRSASQICNIWLVPAGLSQTYSTMQTFWLDTTANKGGLLTGDNVRERPYANLYQKLTTKSNTYTVHMRVQTLKQVKTVDPTFASWVEGSDLTTGEYRGSSTIERYLDASSSSIPDYATLTQPLAAGQSIDNFYKFRVIETKQFTP